MVKVSLVERIDSYKTDVKILTPEAEAELGNRIKEAGNVEDRKHLVLANIGFAIKKATRREPGYVELDDLIQESMLALVFGSFDFDPERGRFTTHVGPKIRNRLGRAKYTQSDFINLGIAMGERMRKLNNIEAEYVVKKKGKRPTSKWLAKRLKMKEEDVEYYRRFKFIKKSLNNEIEGHEGGGLLEEFIPGSGFNPTEVAALNSISREELCNILIEALDKICLERINNGENPDKVRKSRDIVLLKFGFISEEEMTLEQIGQIYGQTRENIRQILERTIAKMKVVLNREDLSDFF